MSNFKNAVYITKKLMAAFNIKDFQAVGFTANFMGESGCEPSSVNKAEKAGTFRGSSANGAGYGAGLAQWSNSWKTTIQKQFNNYNPIETWTLDQQIAIVIRGCGKKYIDMFRAASNAAEAVDLGLRGYENGNGGVGGTTLRSKQSMNAYTWAKTVYVYGVGKQTFATGYEGLMHQRVAFAKAILQHMGNYSAADLANLGNISGDGDFGDFGGGGGGIVLTQADIAKLIEQYKNAYPVHSEYETYTGGGGNIFSNSKDNAFSTATIANAKDNRLNQYTNTKGKLKNRTRIYSTNDSCIVLDELKLSLDTEKNDSWSNKDITQSDVDKWQKQQDKQKEEAKKKAEEEAKKKAEEEANKDKDKDKTTDTSKDKKDKKTDKKTDKK